MTEPKSRNAEAQSRVLIVGGGPAGLIIAIELGRRGVPCVLFEQSVEPPAFPKANSTTSRTMEHYRRLRTLTGFGPAAPSARTDEVREPHGD